MQRFPKSIYAQIYFYAISNERRTNLSSSLVNLIGAQKAATAAKGAKWIRSHPPFVPLQLPHIPRCAARALDKRQQSKPGSNAIKFDGSCSRKAVAFTQSSTQLSCPRHTARRVAQCSSDERKAFCERVQHAFSRFPLKCGRSADAEAIREMQVKPQQNRQTAEVPRSARESCPGRVLFCTSDATYYN